MKAIFYDENHAHKFNASNLAVSYELETNNYKPFGCFSQFGDQAFLYLSRWRKSSKSKSFSIAHMINPFICELESLFFP